MRLLHVVVVTLHLFSGYLATNPEEYADIMRKVKVNLLNLGLKESSSATPPPIDLVFLVDESSCMGKANYIMGMRLAKKLLDFFSVSPGTTRVGLMTYSDVTRERFEVGQHVNRKATQKSILQFSTSYSGKQVSNLGEALTRVRGWFDGFTRPNTKKILVVLTNGASSSGADIAKIPAAIAAMELAGVKRYVMSIGKMIHATNIEAITSTPLSGTGPQIYHFIFKSVEAIKWVINLLPEAYYMYCNKPGKWHDECNMECECVNGHVINCKRVRQEINSMSIADRTLYINTYRKLTHEQPYKAIYDQFIAIHSTHFFDGIHSAIQFLPWHRWFINTMENFLMGVDCRVTLPYWDWSLVSADPWNMQNLFGDRPDGLGSRSSGIDPFDPIACVTDGPFGAQTGWRTQSGRCLQRFLFGPVPDLITMMEVLDNTDFTLFEEMLRVNLHDTVHCAIGGTMCGLDSATVPEFFLHHGFIDKLWWDKQQQNQHMFVGIFDPPGAKPALTVTPFTANQFLNLTDMPGHISATYARPTAFNAEGVIRFCHSRTISQLLSTRRKHFSVYNETAANLFKITDAEKARAKAFEAHTQQVLSQHKLTTTLSGNDKLRGFQLPDEFKATS